MMSTSSQPGGPLPMEIYVKRPYGGYCASLTGQGIRADGRHKMHVLQRHKMHVDNSTREHQSVTRCTRHISPTTGIEAVQKQNKDQKMGASQDARG